MSYTVQFLNDEQFEALPGSDMEARVGVAYPQLQRAYVRKSGMPVIDAFTAAHELEHLEGNPLDEHYDAVNSCYYKNFGSVLSAIAPVALGLFGGPLLGGLGSALGGAGNALAGGLGAINPALGGAARSIGGAIGSVGQGAGKLFGGGGGGGFSSDDAMAQMQGNISGNALANSPGEIFGGAPNVIPSSLGGGGAAGGGGMGGSLGNGAGSLMESVFGSQSPMQFPQMPDFMGSFSPSVNQSPNANVIPGQGGTNQSGLATGAPGGTGGGIGARKIAQQIEGGK